MARKPKEVEQEIDINEKKKRTHAQEWFDTYVVNSKEDIKLVCDLTAKSCWDQFKLYNVDNTELYAVIFHGIFMTILKFLNKQQKKWKEYSIEIANSINIGYMNNTNEDNEKVGNFMPIIEYISVNRNVIDKYDIEYGDKDEVKAKSPTVPKNHTDEQLMMWKVQNLHKTIDNYNKIQEEAVQVLLNEYRINLRNSECVFPIFCIFADNISNVLKMRYKELKGTGVSEVKMNVLGLFEAFYSYDEQEDQEIIEYTPCIAMKLALKNDEIAAE